MTYRPRWPIDEFVPPQRSHLRAFGVAVAVVLFLADVTVGGLLLLRSAASCEPLQLRPSHFQPSDDAHR